MPDDMTSVEAIQWRDGVLRMLDQTRLPHEVAWIETRDYRDVADAIARLAVRGAPLIGIAAA
ncbi:MAG TPA: S-methyl-5-thioribose-1-phosphate isomerase, partial [Dehalococcoidia bacterium]|nr:S-methyl-5-thioribose-1-phosphate isomerase [Dehalococcoidia bacterium]